MVVFGCITDQGWVSTRCIYNANADACRFGNAIGIIAFLALMAFLVSDAMFDNISNVMHRKYVIMADVVFSGVYVLHNTVVASHDFYSQHAALLIVGDNYLTCKKAGLTDVDRRCFTHRLTYIHTSSIIVKYRT